MPKPSYIPASDISELIRIACQHGLTEVVVQQNGARVEIRLSPGAEVVVPAPAPARASDPDVPEAPPRPGIQVRSPMTGVYYGAPSPDEPPFVHPGDVVQEGDPIGLIEAMKVFSEVLSDQAGIVERVLVLSGQLVQQGDALVELSPVDGMEMGDGQDL
jgi:acetyl-CoA carboxylase biotin carboxyl carrier protein